MMDRTQYLLTKLAEECSEVAQIALKAQQFGLQGVYQIDTNAQRIHKELDDLWAILRMLNEESSLNYEVNAHAIKAKMDKVNEYWNYSKNLGCVQ